jgi:hypothetical protein
MASSLCASSAIAAISSPSFLGGKKLRLKKKLTVPARTRHSYGSSLSFSSLSEFSSFQVQEQQYFEQVSWSLKGADDCSFWCVYEINFFGKGAFS